MRLLVRLTAAGLVLQLAYPAMLDSAAVRGVISGRVVEHQSIPVGDATVTLLRNDGAVVAHVVSDKDGGFQFKPVPAGRYRLLSARPDLVPPFYGYPVEQGIPVAVAGGEEVAELVIQMSRGATILGTVLDANGAPASGLPVYAIPAVHTSLMEPSVELRPVVSDERGVYELTGLLPGHYYVVADQSSGRNDSDAAEMPSSGEIDQKLAALRARAAGQSAPTPSTPTHAPTFVLGPVFHPGTAQRTMATKVFAAAGAVTRAVDIQLQPVPSQSLVGRIVRPADGEVQDVSVRLNSVDVSRSVGGMTAHRSERVKDVAFRLSGLAPGTYWLDVSASLAGQDPRGRLRYGAHVTLGDGGDLELDIELRRPTVVSGHVVRVPGEGEADALATVEPASVELKRRTAPVRRGQSVTMVVAAGVIEARLAANREFRFAAVGPGLYDLSVPSPERASGRQWHIVAATTSNGPVWPALMVPNTSSTIDVNITVGRQPSTITGTVTGGTSDAQDFCVLAFPAERRAWALGPGVVVAEPIDNVKRYTLTGLLAGDYLVAAAVDCALLGEVTASDLERYSAVAVPVRVAAGQTSVQDVTIAGGRTGIGDRRRD